MPYDLGDGQGKVWVTAGESLKIVKEMMPGITDEEALGLIGQFKKEQPEAIRLVGLGQIGLDQIRVMIIELIRDYYKISPQDHQPATGVVEAMDHALHMEIRK